MIHESLAAPSAAVVGDGSGASDAPDAGNGAGKGGVTGDPGVFGKHGILDAAHGGNGTSHAAHGGNGAPSTIHGGNGAAHARDLLDEFEAGQLANDFDLATPQEVLEWALGRWHPRLAICTSFQAEGMAIFDMAWRINPEVRLFTVDTGRLPQETYDMMELVREHYGVAIEVHLPDAAKLERMTTRFGPNLFRRSVEARLLCCSVRKVEPVRGALDALDAWVTGLRRDQWASRANIRKLEIDHDHGGLAKLNPLADWTAAEVWDYNHAHGVPEHPLYARGFTSIGCAPCTRATAAGEDPRAGRWWWEKNAPKECGIHCPLETGGLEHELEAMLPGGEA